MSCKLSSAVLLFLATTVCIAQQVDAAAQALIARSHAAFSGGRPVTSVTMSGTASWHYGSDQQTGTVQLTANADGSSRMELHLDKGTRIETQTAFNADPQCTWIGFDGVEHKAALHNCWSSTVWFLPQITLQSGAGASDTMLKATVSNQLHQERSASKITLPSAAAILRRASANDFEVDPITALPNILRFNAHPEKDVNRDIPTAIHFSDYRQIQGVALPFRIQRLINDSLVLDFQISSVTVNFAATAPIGVAQ